MEAEGGGAQEAVVQEAVESQDLNYLKEMFLKFLGNGQRCLFFYLYLHVLLAVQG